jgi:ribonuclease R
LSEDAILAFIARSPGFVGKREIGRAFNIKGNDKIHLKMLLKQMEQQGKLSRARKTVKATATIPSVGLIEIIKLDDDGDVIGKLAEWDEEVHGPAPQMRVEAKGHAAPGVGDRVLARIDVDKAGEHIARVMRGVSDQAQRVVGIFRKSTGHGGRILPSSKKDRDDYMVPKGDDLGADDGDLVSAEVVRHRGRGLAQARVRQRLGRADDPKNTSLIAIHAHGLPDAFPKAVEDEAAEAKPLPMGDRKDLRHLPIITIDPADARDHDDAVWATADEAADNPGGHIVIVAIADVAAYVTPGSQLDREALKRGNSVYFPDRVVPMLPEKLSTDLCSLIEGVDRPVLAVTMRFDAEGKKLSQLFDRAMIRVAAGLAYEDAQAAIDGKGSPQARALLKNALQPLWSAYASLCKARDKRGPLDLDLPERKVLLDDKGNFKGVVSPPRLDAHRLIEEFMIQANVAAAEVLQKRKTPLLLRVHEQPSAEKLRALASFLQTVNIPFTLGQLIRSRTFNRILSQAKGSAQERLIHEIVLRTQSQARYSPRNDGHFGLSLANYAHFTSPIRRYADLIVHRALISAHKLGADGLSSQNIANLEDIAEQISGAERRAMIAERETLDRLVAAFLRNQVGAEFDGRISGATSAGLFVVLSEAGADGFVPASTLGAERYIHDPVAHAMVGSRTGETYQLGDPIRVRLVEVAPIKGGLRFEPVSDGKTGKPAKHKPAFRRRR